MKNYKLLLSVSLLGSLTVSQFQAASQIEVDPCSLSGERQANVVVDIGYDSPNINRDYYGYTNSSGQLVKVTAAEIILQNDRSEDVTSSGRYCSDEAKVPGTESSELDEGHVIADSLGGVSNAYNITPQDKDVNRTGGEQYQMETDIRIAEQNGQDVTDFNAQIIYPNTSTQIPSSYKISYKIDGKVISTNFINGQYGEGNYTEVNPNYNGNILTKYYENGILVKAAEKTQSGRKVADYKYYTSGKVKEKVTFTNNSSNVRNETIRYNESGKRTEYYTYHSNGKVKRKYLYNNGVKKETIEYDSVGKRVYVWSYHSNGNVKQRTEYNSSGKRSTATVYSSSNKKIEYYTYFSNGKVKRKYTYASNGARKETIEYTSSGKRVYSWSYYSNSQVKQRIKYNSNGKKSDTKMYSSSGKLTYDYDYRSNGKVLRKTSYYSNDNKKFVYNYNPNGVYDSKWESSKKYSSCAKIESANITTPVPKGTKLYSANTGRDGDKDGLICE